MSDSCKSCRNVRCVSPVTAYFPLDGRTLPWEQKSQIFADDMLLFSVFFFFLEQHRDPTSLDFGMFGDVLTAVAHFLHLTEGS